MGRLSNEEKTRRSALPLGAAVTEPPKDAIREPIKQMTGFATESDLKEALPTNTMQPDSEEAAPRRKRRSKEEMAAARGAAAEPQVDDPNMLDPRYRKAVEKMRSAGISTTVKGGFKAAAVATKDDIWELEPEEIVDVDDFSYVVSKKFPIFDPTRHWLSMALYFMALMGTLIFKRAAKAGMDSWIKKLTNMFGGDDEPDAQELENQKAESV